MLSSEAVFHCRLGIPLWYFLIERQNDTWNHLSNRQVNITYTLRMILDLWEEVLSAYISVAIWVYALPELNYQSLLPNIAL